MRPQDFLTPEEFACLKAACKDDKERAIVLTLAGTGMSRLSCPQVNFSGFL
jgi:hypothetical protein